MTREQFNDHITELAGVIHDRELDHDLQAFLNREYGPRSDWFRGVTRLCRLGVEEGWMCERQSGAIRYGRVTRPDSSAGRFSVDVVEMPDCKGPYHIHPAGEIDMIMPLSADARFDGHGEGWLVYPPGSAHFPTVSGGEALILYLLPDGKIEFTSPG